jgi:hypothetical protein
MPDPGKIEAVLRFPTPKTVTSVRSFLGLTGYYRKHIRGYSRLAGPLFELTRKDVVFVWDMGCQQAYQALKTALVDAHVLTRPNFKRTFWLDVDWSPKGVGAILSQKEWRFDKLVAYASKSLTKAQRKFHPMEGECYALIWGVMHFRQYLHQKHFILCTDHKPLEWLATVSDAHGGRGRWVGMLQDFSFKIIHRPGLRHTNIDALNRNPVGPATDDDDFSEEIPDMGSSQTDTPKGEGELLFVQTGKETEWLDIRRKDRELVQHCACCFGINHCRYGGIHQLYMVDVVSEEEQPKELVPGGVEIANGNEFVQDEGEGMVLKRRKPQYFDKRQQLDLVLATQELAEYGDPELSTTKSNDEEDREVDARCIDIWKDAVCLGLLREAILPDTIDLEESKRARKKVSNYCWKEQRPYFKGLFVPKPEERTALVIQMHEDLGHFGEQRTLAEIRQRYFWHNRTKDHGAKTASKFLEDDIICRYGVPKFVLTDNGGEWAAEFEVMCKDYGIQHQRTAPQWLQCNGMAKRMIKTIKHGITVLLQHQPMWIVGTSTWPRFCLGTDVASKPTLSFHLS